MKPRKPQPENRDIFKQSLVEMLNLKHPLVKLADTINWNVIIEQFSGYFVSDRGRPGLSPRLVAGLLYLQHAYDCSDEEIVNTWIESPYVQYFTGETYFQTEVPMYSSSLTRWRKRIGEEGVELLLQVTIEAGTQLSMLRASSFNRIIVDTTVMPKAIAHPTDSRLLERSREHLVKFAVKHNLSLRQNYNREAPRLALMAGRYAHAKQYRRMRKANKLLKTRVGRVMRDVQRQLDTLPEHHQIEGKNLLFLVNRILTQQKKDKKKLYALHAPEVSCIAKGKARLHTSLDAK
jgi:IS5 family transposase